MGSTKEVDVLAFVDRGHRKLPIQPDFCGKRVSNSINATLPLLPVQVDGKEVVFLEY